MREKTDPKPSREKDNIPHIVFNSKITKTKLILQVYFQNLATLAIFLLYKELVLIARIFTFSFCFETCVMFPLVLHFCL